LAAGSFVGQSVSASRSQQPRLQLGRETFHYFCHVERSRDISNFKEGSS